MTYDEIRPTLKTGDIIGMSGRGLFSKLIRFGTRKRDPQGNRIKTKWTHVALVIDPSELAARQLTVAKRKKLDRTLLCFESTTLSQVRDIETGEFVKGVQTSLLSERIATYKGDVWIRRLNKKLSKEQIEAIMALRQEVKGRSYERSWWSLVRAAIDWPFSRQRKDLSTIFCSELEAAAYQVANLLGLDPSASEHDPADFEIMRELLHGYELGMAVPITKGAA